MANKVLSQDQPQQDESLYPERVREYEQAKKEQEEAEAIYQKELELYNKEKAKYDADLAKWESESKAAQIEYEKKLKEFNDKFFTEYGITYDSYLKDVEEKELSEKQAAERKAKQEADRVALLKPYDEKIAKLESEKQEKLSEAHASVWGVGGSRNRSELTDLQNKIIRDYKSYVGAVQAERTKAANIYDFRVAYPDTPIQGSIRERFYKSGGQTSLVDLKESLDKSKTAQAEYQKQTSVQSARIDALKAAEKYTMDVSAYANSIQNFTDNKPRLDPFVMQNPTQEFTERLNKITDTKLPVPTVAALSQKYDKEGFKMPLLTQSQNRPTAVGVKFQTVESTIQKPTEIKSYFIAGKEYESTPEIDAIVKLSVRTPSKLNESIYLGVLEEKGIKPTEQGKELISLFKSENVGYSQLERKAVYTNPKTGETFNAATMEGSYAIGKALGFQYDQNMYLPTYVTSETTESIPLFSLSGFESVSVPITDNDKKQKLVDASIESTLQFLDSEGQKKDGVTDNYPSTIIKGAVIEGSKDILAGIGFASNVFHEYVEPFNLRGEPKSIYIRKEELDFKNAYSFLGSAGKVLAENLAAQSTIQFDKPQVESMQVPPTLINTAIEEPEAVPAYVEKYGAGSIVGAVGVLGIGATPSKESYNLVKIKFKNFFKITDNVPVINPVTNKIYPEIRLQKPLTIEDANMVSEKPVEVLFTKQTVDLGKAKVTAPIKESFRVQATPENFARWDQPAKLPKTGQAPISSDTFDFRVSLADKAGAVPKIISHKPVVDNRVTPVPENFARWDQPAKLPKTGQAPIKPDAFDFTISLPDKAGEVPKVVPNTPIMNQRIAPVPENFARWDQPAKLPKTGQAPISSDTFDFRVSLPDKAGEVPKVVPNTPLITDKVTTAVSFNAARWNVPAKLPKTGKAPFESSLFQSDTQKLIKKMESGKAPSIAPVKFKLDEIDTTDYLDSMLTKRSTTQKIIVPKGEPIPSFKDLHSKASILNLKDTPPPVKKLTVSHAPMGINYNVGKKYAWGFTSKPNAAPITVKGASTDLTRAVPKGGKAPNIMWSWKPKEELTPTYDSWLAGLSTKRSSKKVVLPKGIDEETVFTPIDDIDPTKMKFKEDPYEKWLKSQKKSKNPLDSLGNEFKENKNVLTSERDPNMSNIDFETKIDDAYRKIMKEYGETDEEIDAFIKYAKEEGGFTVNPNDKLRKRAKEKGISDDAIEKFLKDIRDKNEYWYNTSNEQTKTIQVMKPETKPPTKKKQRLDEPDVYAPESSSISSDSFEEPIRITSNNRSPTGILSVSQSKNMIDVNVSTMKVSKTAVTPLNIFSTKSSQKESSRLNIDVSPKYETRSKVDVYSKTSTKEKASEKARQRAREIEIQKSIQQTAPKQKPRQTTKPKQIFRTPEKTPTKQTPRLAIDQPFRQRETEIFKPNTPERNKTRRIIVGGADKKRKESKKDSKSKLKEYLGNVSEVQIEGVYNRSTLIYGKKKVSRLVKKDYKKHAPKKVRIV